VIVPTTTDEDDLFRITHSNSESLRRVDPVIKTPPT
jgi:hypothetical protein